MNNLIGFNLMYELKHIRKELNITQKQLSEKTGLKQQYISQLETFKYIPNLDTLQKIVSALNCSLVLIDNNCERE